MSKRVSVAMAVCNGELYIKEQVNSVVSQLGDGDELVISIDPSKDASEAIISALASQDDRIRVLKGPGQGVIKNFETILKHVDGEYIFLADQDDIWVKDKMKICLGELKKTDIDMVVHDAIIVDEGLQPISGSFFNGEFYSGVWKNILKNRYIGCCMAFKKKLLSAALPFPRKLPMHDQWLGLVAAKTGSVLYIDKPLILYRRHQKTLTGNKRSNIITIIKWRFNITSAYLKLCAKRNKA